jgi:hypothetical protein
MGLALPDFGFDSFESDAWRFSAVCVVVVGVAVVPSYFLYRSSRIKTQLHHKIALLQAETKLQQARGRTRRTKPDAPNPPESPGTLY